MNAGGAEATISTTYNLTLARNCPPTARASGSSRGFLIAVRCNLRCDVRASAKLRGKRAGTGRGTFDAGRTSLLRVKLTKATARKLRNRRSATFVVTVRATAGGLNTTKTVRFTARRARR